MYQLRTLATLAVCAAGVATAAVLPSGLSSQEDASAQETPAPEPTAVHKKLLEGVGEWVGKLDSKYPGTPPMVVPATETVTALGPFHTVSNFHCEFFGTAYHGLGIMGYDEANDEMFGTWTDNMNAHTSVMRGKTNLRTGVTEMHYEAPGPDGGPMMPHRNVMQNSKDAYTITFYMGEGDSEVETMKISMKRKK